MEHTTFIHHAHPKVLEAMFQQYQSHPDDLDPSWRIFFDGFQLGQSGENGSIASGLPVERELNVLNLINAYRTRGHLFAEINPLKKRKIAQPTLDLEHFNLSEQDLGTVFQAGTSIGIGPSTLQEIVQHLQTTYCKSIATEFMFIREPDKVNWIKQRLESSKSIPQFSLEKKRRILDKLNRTTVFESFLHTKYAGQTRFSLQGMEALIPAMDCLIQEGAELGIESFIFGMPHRGRLNVLANIFKKDRSEIFSEFEGKEYASTVFEGDVKYHLGYNSIVTTTSGKRVQLIIAPNPSHLEAVNPVVEGMARSKLDNVYKGDENKVAVILLHGDASVAAQGIIYEVLQMSLLDGYRTGGTIHLVLNNQIGFTTNDFEGRSSTYCTDVAKVTLSPVFHVNADDVEAVILALEMALEYRQTFHTDVFIDMVGYRRFGHNEGDEPRFTQPQMYKEIDHHPNCREIYFQSLLKHGGFEEDLAQSLEQDFLSQLKEDLVEAQEGHFNGKTATFVDDCELKTKTLESTIEPSSNTCISMEELQEIGKQLFTIPESFHALTKIKRLFMNRYQSIVENKNLDWAMAELLAYGSLLNEGIPIRLSGQDSARGTFSHRHAVVLDEETEEKLIPLTTIREGQAKFQVHNSPLSEYGVLGFEYGYACASPYSLTIWEAQYGDFCNGAQIIIDQFIASSQAKWNRSNGVVLFLPHGYEGQGPEHSSGRIDRFLSMCAHDNMQICNCTTPANFFHLLRGHVKSTFRHPLIVFTPKSLLRSPICVSAPEDFTQGQFQRIIDDPIVDKQKVKRLCLCSGKIYYDLAKRQKDDNRQDVGIIRIEQLYPIALQDLKRLVYQFTNAIEFIYVQEESENQGPWSFLRRKLDFMPLRVIARAEASSPANGYYKYQEIEQKDIVNKVFDQPFRFFSS